jgi:chemotaxis protein MotB
MESNPQSGNTVELLPSLQFLNEQLKREIEAGRLDVKLERRGLVISLKEAAFFPPGADTIQPGALPTLETIAAELNRTPNPIRLEGHTDSIPINTERFRSNWHLSSSRAVSMLQLFSERFGIPAERMGVAGFADTAPVAANDTADGRAKNRRVDIVVLNEEAVIAEPARAPQATHSN